MSDAAPPDRWHFAARAGGSGGVGQTVSYLGLETAAGVERDSGFGVSIWALAAYPTADLNSELLTKARLWGIETVTLRAAVAGAVTLSPRLGSWGSQAGLPGALHLVTEAGAGAAWTDLAPPRLWQCTIGGVCVTSIIEANGGSDGSWQFFATARVGLALDAGRWSLHVGLRYLLIPSARRPQPLGLQFPLVVGPAVPRFPPGPRHYLLAGLSVGLRIE